MVDTMEYAPYSTGAKYCSECRITCLPFLIVAPVVPIGFRTHSRIGSIEHDRTDSTSSEIVAYHKVKRRFINLKDMHSEDPDLLQIYEFKGQDFDLVMAN